MKHSELRAIAHNFADSLASGLHIDYGGRSDIFGEISQSPEKYIVVDFLTGDVEGCQPSQVLRGAIAYYKKTLPEFFEKNHASVSDVRELKVRYYFVLIEKRFLVTFTDARGRQSITEYGGWGGKRVKVLDWLGRLRPKIGM
ncbi:hypothetical protein [Bradyrhizobium sp. SYSU BS000235]|uniref:hypothetical protein n=1 Tax=Bradyrhizobium sp. SYSU BS000235 TaxID=3411332 RepID=UPI003C72A2CB